MVNIKPRSVVKKTLKVANRSLYHPPIPSNMIVVIDTQEQIPYVFPECHTFHKKLSEGDYSIEGWEDKITVERKTATDFFGSIVNNKDTDNRDRLEREFERMKDYKFKGLVIEAEEQNILCPEIYGRQTGSNTVYGSIISFEIKYGLNVYYGSREWCENKILNWFIYWMKMYGDGVNVGQEI